jgi:hypothetical protein
MNWSWALPDPDWWILERSADGVSGWTVYNTLSGSNRFSSTDNTEKYYRVRGETPLGVPYTEWSSVVHYIPS